MRSILNYFLLLTLAFPGLGLAADVYVVKKSDTLSGIAKKHQTNPDTIASLNGIKLTSVLQIGQKIKVPPTFKTHVVRSGETLGVIASKHKLTLSQLAAYNGISNPNKLSIGQQLKVPLNTSGGSAIFKTVKPKHPQLPSSINRSLARTSVRSGKWQYIVVHHSASERGSAAGIDRYHREERRMENGMAYHFVIGNGKGMGDGEIAIGNRWKTQLHGGHMASSALNNKCVGICLIGNFENQRPSTRQLNSLEALCRYLMKRNRLSYHKVRAHGSINSKPTACPGKNLNITSLVNRLKT